MDQKRTHHQPIPKLLAVKKEHERQTRRRKRKSLKEKKKKKKKEQPKTRAKQESSERISHELKEFITKQIKAAVAEAIKIIAQPERPIPLVQEDSTREIPSPIRLPDNDTNDHSVIPKKEAVQQANGSDALSSHVGGLSSGEDFEYTNYDSYNPSIADVNARSE